MSFFIQVPNYITHANKLNEHLSEISLNKITNTYSASITTNFNINNPAHMQIISQCNSELACKYNALKKLDVQIATGSLVGIAALGLSYILPLSLVAIAGFAFAAYCFGKREQVSKEFKSALSNSIQCIFWSLHDISNKDRAAILNSDVINTMTKIIAPLTNKKQLESLIDDKYENEFITRAINANKVTIEGVLGRPLNKEEQHHVFGIYGYDQGNIINIGKGLLYALGQLFTAAKHAISNRLNKEKLKPEEATNIAPKTGMK